MIAQICNFAKKAVPLSIKINNLNMIETNRIEFKRELTCKRELEISRIETYQHDKWQNKFEQLSVKNEK